MKLTPTTRGFTIVELLIVIVVIAILAAITIVAYNGISQRAKESVAQSEAAQVGKKLAAEMITNGDQVPADIEALGLKNGDGVSYQYSRNTSASPQTYCVTVTKNNVSYFVHSSDSAPKKGACPGHGADGVQPITNLVINPQVTSYSGEGLKIGTGRWFGSGGTGAYTIETGATPVGNVFGRKTWTTAPTGGSGDTGFNAGSLPVVAGETYTFSAFLRSTKPRWHEFGASLFEVGSSTSTTRARSSVQLIPANTWTRVSWTYTIPSNIERVSMLVDITGTTTGGALAWANGDTLDVTGYMATRGDTLYAYADGSSDTWLWNGTANASTSSGAPL